MSTLKPRIKTSAKWTADNTILRKNEMGFESNTGNYKIGDGSTAWNMLPYYPADNSKHKRLEYSTIAQLQFSGNQQTIINNFTIPGTINNVERVGVITFSAIVQNSQSNNFSFDILINGVVQKTNEYNFFQNEKHKVIITAIRTIPANSQIQIRLTKSSGTLSLDLGASISLDAVLTSNTL